MNYNVLSQTSFRAIIADEKAREYDYFVQTTNIPSISVSPAPAPYKNRRTKFPGETVDYSPLNFTFIVSEDLHSRLVIENKKRGRQGRVVQGYHYPLSYQ